MADIEPHPMSENAPISDTPAGSEPVAFQGGVAKWMDVCFGPEIASDRLERADRFIEEALELCQTWPEFTADRAHALVDYVFGRPVGEPAQEVGGVMVTLAALCNTAGIDIEQAAQTELARVWTKVEAIRAKQAAKPTGSALPIAHPTPSPEVAQIVAWLREGGQLRDFNGIIAAAIERGKWKQ